MLSIFSYTDPASYLRDSLEEKKKANSSFSLRSWAQSLGMKSHGPLHAMLKGDRNIPKKYVPLLIKSLKLQKKEASYFEALVDLQRAKSIEEKKMYNDRLKLLAPKETRETHDVEAYKFVSEPLHVFLFEMTQLKSFQNSIGWIKSKLRINENLKTIEETLKRLQNLEMLTPSEKGFDRKIQHIYTAQDVMNKAIQEGHQKMCSIAADQVSKQPVEQREYSSVTFNIKKKDLPKIKEEIRELSDQIIQNYETKDGEGEETYALNVQFFSISKID